ncbi:MAG: aspartyl/glutamyl-tRNA amidotransferase subunit A [Parcubacteria group bacterium RIFCSPLOWO2_01_FULL_40_65]|nr:MAG: aspartyl/glutamyl-tRNA amidotransferase subunit A [Parcubacteria group bacterium RIFCSPHIGHO2_01_FULL_40_30]OHB19018.1 MAG: aspartyl/glutamyl-tRNA amidotransferase subunit A [Parcubacteria group bacterium RIFCSPHIGHO2_02_FULL_40_12]OHB22290.1 MAG: aspartyl/glutamyl-tRNA amidotransferase subunit A [Parcubacteria group bacterium RIFCSPLOWO2_01_FULL_40_65]OHB23644.1 MAG: aspartyl/glutamyl-tRNA amidotransferase subunit A [Parcubacteria group bacterium RIFCSPLOWO2_02_FULL_40_12]OHB24266.1 MA
MNIKNLTIREVKRGLDKKEFSQEELRQEFLKSIKKKNPDLNAYLSVFKNEEPEVNKGVLAGVPCAIKDNILINGTGCTAASKILENYISTYDATVIKKLRGAGAVFLGKTNLDEFAMGSSTENSAFGPTKNPHDLTRVPGGSSGGSAAAVVAGLSIFALGSDTGGSIRLPASFCGVVGLKPTYGRVSRHGLMAMASSLDQIGPITKNSYDAALVLNIIAGSDKFDSTAVPKEAPDYTSGIDKSIKGLKIGIPKEYFSEGLDGKVNNVIQKAISKLQNLGAEIIDISLPHSEYALASYYIIMPCEVSSNLARYDGIKYGFSAKAKNLIDTYLKSREGGFGEEARRRIMLGTYALSAGYYNAYYKKAQQVRALIKKDFDEAFKKVDVIAGPTAPTVAFKLGEKVKDPLTMYLSDVYTVAINLAGVPALSVPCGFVNNLPVGLQLIGKHFDEAVILRTAHNYEHN